MKYQRLLEISGKVVNDTAGDLRLVSHFGIVASGFSVRNPKVIG